MQKEQMSDFNRIQILKNALNECRMIREYYLPAVEKELNKGITHIENNSQSFFFPALNYVFEKTGNIKSSVEHIEYLSELKYLD